MSGFFNTALGNAMFDGESSGIGNTSSVGGTDFQVPPITLFSGLNSGLFNTGTLISGFFNLGPSL